MSTNRNNLLKAYLQMHFGVQGIIPVKVISETLHPDMFLDEASTDGRPDDIDMSLLYEDQN
jgi:hypothetical protein